MRDEIFTNSEATYVDVDLHGNLRLPATMMARLEMEGGGQLVFVDKDSSITAVPLGQHVANLQAQFKKMIPEGISLVEELRAERREEAARGN